MMNLNRCRQCMRAPLRMPLWLQRWAPLLMAAAVLGGCAALAPGGLPLGTPIAQARQAWFGPAAQYALPGGGTRLEFDQGSFGRQTYMLDFNGEGRLVASHQVLNEVNFATITPGLSAAEVLMRLGHPVQVFPVGWQKLHVWNYRYPGGDCVWFQVSIRDADRKVHEAGIGQDPTCDGPRSRD